MVYASNGNKYLNVVMTENMKVKQNAKGVKKVSGEINIMLCSVNMKQT